MKYLAIAFVLFSLSFVLNAKYKGQLELITPQQLIANKQSYIVLDTRSAEEFAEGHIKGAINIPHDQVAANLDLLTEYSETIVVHCRSGRRALVAEQALLDAGFTNVKHLAGDMKGWKAQNLPLESKD